MSDKNEVTLATIDGTTDFERVLVVLAQFPANGSRIELRQQSWGEGVGWFTQSSVQVDPSQVRQLCTALGGVRSSSSSDSKHEFDEHSIRNSKFRVIRAASA